MSSMKCLIRVENVKVDVVKLFANGVVNVKFQCQYINTSFNLRQPEVALFV